MKKNTFQIPERVNEETKDYLKGSQERKTVIETYNSMYSQKIDIPLYIGEEEIYTCLLYTSPSPRDGLLSRMPSSA